MYKPLLWLLPPVAALTLGTCTQPRLPPPTTAPVLREPTDSLPDVSRIQFTLAPGRYRYRYTQNTTIRADTATASTPSAISTLAMLLVDVAQDSDSSYTIAISVDSLQLNTQGQIPNRSTGSLALGLVLEASLTNESRTISPKLPDSLCNYAQFVGIARQLLPSKLPTRASSPITAIDTVTSWTCRAGARINISAYQQLHTLRSEPPYQMALDEQAHLTGTGTLGKDSVSVTGSLTTRGTIDFAEAFRLPSAVKTGSRGSITVRLGNSITSFSQESTQQMIREAATPP